MLHRALETPETPEMALAWRPETLETLAETLETLHGESLETLHGESLETPGTGH